MKRATVLKVKSIRKRQKSDIAAGGNLNAFLGVSIRKKVDVLSTQECRSMAYIIRLALSRLFAYYAEKGTLPPWSGEEFKGRRPGRPRVFDTFRE